MIPNKEKGGWYLTVKKLSELLRGTTSKYDGDFYDLTYLHSFRKKNKLESRGNYAKKKKFRGIAMPSEKGNIIKLNQYMNW